jgi:putative DNA primase/helicase
MDEIKNPGAVDAHGASDGVLADAIDNTTIGEIRQGEEHAQLPPSAFLEHLKLTMPVVTEAKPSRPMDTANMFVVECFMRNCSITKMAGKITLVRDNGEFFAWDGTRYVLIPEENIRAALYVYLEHANYVKRNKDGVPEWIEFSPNSTKINQALDALKAVCRRPITHTSPSWLDPMWNVLATDYVAFQNGRLYLPTYNFEAELEPHTPDFYNHNALPFDYDPFNWKIPEWQNFLHSIWPDNPDAIACLQEMFGYLVAGGTYLHKILMIIGPRRSGKGTIGRVLNSLLGKENCCGPTLASLAGDFGLAPLLGKSLATIPDARFGAGQKVVVERLLMVSGEDVVTVNRKHKEAVECILPTRFLIMSNELPALEDASSALSSRFVLLTMTNSFLGREDHDLMEKLILELPGILIWALDGWMRLSKQGRFTVPSSSESALTELEELGSPVGVFASEMCEFGPDFQVTAKDLFDHWVLWCDNEGRSKPGTAQMFGRNLRAACSNIERVRGRDKSGRRPWIYRGLRLISNSREVLRGLVGDQDD